MTGRGTEGTPGQDVTEDVTEIFQDANFRR